MTVGGSTLRKAPFILLARLLGKPLVLHLHGGRYAAQYASWSRARRALARASFRAADRVIVLGPRMRAFIADELGVPQAAIVELPNAVAGPLVAPERAAGDVCRIAFVGALHEPKGLGDLLDALGDRRLRARRWRLSVLGKGDRELWSARAASLGIGERVRFTGWLAPAEVSSALAATDLFVLPSHAEGMSLAVLEAMAHGCAIVTTPVGEHLDVIDHGADGMLVPPGEVGALVAALLGLIDLPAQRARLGRAARARYERCHTIERYVVRLAGIYRELLSPRRRAARPAARSAMIRAAERRSLWLRSLAESGWDGMFAVAALLLVSRVLIGNFEPLMTDLYAIYWLLYLATGILMFWRFGVTWIVWAFRQIPLLGLVPAPRCAPRYGRWNPG